MSRIGGELDGGLNYDSVALSGVMWVFSGTVVMNLMAWTGKKAPIKRQMGLTTRRETERGTLLRRPCVSQWHVQMVDVMFVSS